MRTSLPEKDIDKIVEKQWEKSVRKQQVQVKIEVEKRKQDEEEYKTMFKP